MVELASSHASPFINFARSGARTAYIQHHEPGASGTGEFRFGTGSSHSPTNTMTISYDNKVGIGTTNPGALLDIKESATDVNAILLENSQSGGSTINMSFKHQGQNAAMIKVGKHGNYLGSTTRTGSLQFHTSSSGAGAFMECMRMYFPDDNLHPRIGIGETAPNAPLHIKRKCLSSQQGTILSLEAYNTGDQEASMTADLDFYLVDGNTDTGVPQCRIGATGDGTSDQNHEAGGRLSFYVATQSYPSPTLTKRGEFNAEAGGDFYTNDGTVSSLSDVRVKTNITTLTDGLNIVTQLRPVTYEYNNTTSGSVDSLGEKDGITRYGLVADEVKIVAPHYVHEGTGHVNGELVNDFKSLSLQRMIPMLIKSIQELKAELDTAKARIAALES